ncbi:MAG: porin family protein [Bacteroidota bacterium]|nr:porin family protein [Bacteroidota bacterium]
MNKKANKIILLAVAILFSFSAGAQSVFSSRVRNLPNYDYAPYHFGFVLAINKMHVAIDPIDNMHNVYFLSDDADDITPAPDSMRVLGIGYKPQYGFTVGIVSNLRLTEYLDLRFIPSLSFGERVITYDIYRCYSDGENDIVNKEKRIPSTYIDFPLHIKYKSKRIHNVRAYVFGGMKYSLDLASLSKKQRDESNNNLIVKFDQHNYGFELGVGFDYYTNWFKFGTEIKMGYNINDPLKREGNIYSESIESLRPRMFQVSFTFE